MLVFINLHPHGTAGLLTDENVSTFKKLLQTLEYDWKHSEPKGVTSLLCNKPSPYLASWQYTSPSNVISIKLQPLLIRPDNKCLRCEG